MKKAVFIVLLFSFSCNDFLDAELDKSQIAEDNVFSSDVTATAAVTGIYNSISSASPLSGIPNGMIAITALSSGELTNYPQDASLRAFETHQILSSNGNIRNLWNFSYNVIYQANAVIEGVQNSKELSSTVAKQLEGEARFIRAYVYFYLVNLFGDVPLIQGTDYRDYKTVSRNKAEEVYKLMEGDLLTAQSLLSDGYVTDSRVRPNKATATAMLARMYLYKQEYSRAETQASQVIGNPLYQLNATGNISNTFLIGSPETIWQILPVDPQRNTMEGFYFIISSSPPLFNVMTDGQLKHFETGDTRAGNWTSSRVSGANTWYFPFKYKQKDKSAAEAFKECSIVFRLAEMYLIRAEARAQLGKVIGANSASSDLNIIRNRAGLPSTTTSDKAPLLLVIENERWSELFTEYGHRWLDLKRTGRAIEVLGNGITQDDLLYPIPADEFTKAPSLGKQNPGY